MKRLDETVHAMEAIVADVKAGLLPRDYGFFALCSLRFVVDLVQHLEDGGFHDPAWIRGLALDADQRYVDGVRNAPGARPGPWKLAFDVAARGEGKPVKNLLLGINAHIMYDLVVTLSTSIVPARRAQQLADFLRLNDIIRGAVDGVQNELEDGGPEWLLDADIAFGRLDEGAVWGTFKLTRSAAFDEAERLQAGQLSRGDVERRALRIGRALALLPV